ncbi:MAG: DUF2344 domain-containing protein [Firmicutes bacterium]|nr:DUF2344 domain-containing protein [Bacillota bacterium]
MNRIRFRYSSGNELRYLSHLDMLRLFQRAMRRAGLPLLYTRGYSPRPRLSLAAPLPVGVTASKEYGEIYMKGPLSPASFCRRLGGQLPKGLIVTGAAIVPPEEPPLAAVVNAALYRAVWKGRHLPSFRRALQKSLDMLLAQREIMVHRLAKNGKVTSKNIRPFVFSADLLSSDESAPALLLLLQVGSKGGVSPFRFLEQLPLECPVEEERCWRLHRQGLYIYKELLIDPFPEGGDILDGQKNNC